MLTYELSPRRGKLTESLCARIRDDILSGRLAAGEKMPSKRELADHLQISKTTVENAYDQLTTEGYLRAAPRRGFFVERIEPLDAVPAERAPAAPERAPERHWRADLTGSAVDPELFPFSVWAKLTRRELTEHAREILAPVPYNGTWSLRRAVSDYLYRSRGISADPDRIIVGAGTEYLYGMVRRLLGRDLSCGVEEPGYQKIRLIYTANGAKCLDIPADRYGLDVAALRESGARAVHLSPSHNFPTGLITPMRRRQELLEWAGEAPERYIIEDDYDCEFRLAGKPVPTLQSMDAAGRVIYINTFRKSLAPSMRISYMVLPPALMERFRENLGFYSCAVCGFEQYTLAAFLDEGYFERHIARMKKHYRTLRDRFLAMLQTLSAPERVSVGEKDAGLHFLMQLNTTFSHDDLRRAFTGAGIRVRFLSEYYHGPAAPGADHCLVVNYSGLTEPGISVVRDTLEEILR